MKKIFLFVVSALFSMSIFAGVFPVESGIVSSQCKPNPVVTSDTKNDFCTTFSESVASCWPPVGSHKNFTPAQMKFNYNLMVRFYGSLKAACNKSAPSNGSTPQQCIDQWNCYINGGIDSQGGQCSGTKKSCV